MADSDFNMIPVTSSQIESVGYNPETKQLRIAFLARGRSSGSLYEYDQVEQETFDSLVNAPSVGSYFGSTIKGVNPYRKIS